MIIKLFTYKTNFTGFCHPINKEYDFSLLVPPDEKYYWIKFVYIFRMFEDNMVGGKRMDEIKNSLLYEGKYGTLPFVVNEKAIKNKFKQEYIKAYELAQKYINLI